MVSIDDMIRVDDYQEDTGIHYLFYLNSYNSPIKSLSLL